MVEMSEWPPHQYPDMRDKMNDIEAQNALLREAILRHAEEIERLRRMVRLNGLRSGFSHAEIDAVLTGRDAPT